MRGDVRGVNSRITEFIGCESKQYTPVKTTGHGVLGRHIGCAPAARRNPEIRSRNESTIRC